jgi:phosphoglycerate kinase
MTTFRTLDQADLKGMRVLLRVDLNVPMENGMVTDATRIERVAPTIGEVADMGGKVILLAHFGRPKGRDPKESLKPVATEVARVLNRTVAFADDCIGPVAEQAVGAMKPGEILLLENTRFYKEEEKNDPAFVEKLAALGDVFVNDAFSAAHRAHASTEGLAHKLPAYAGRTMQAELDALTAALEKPERPVAAVVGGAKVSSKLDLLGNLITKVDTLIIGGGMANTFLNAQGVNVGRSLCERDLAGTAREIMAKAEAKGVRIVLPEDAVVAEKLQEGAATRTVPVGEVGEADMILDVGPRSVEAVGRELERCRTALWNGPLGAFEIRPFDAGTNAAAR